MDWYKKVLRSYAVFEGRAQRKEFWMFLLFNVLVTFALHLIDAVMVHVPLLSVIYSIAILVPYIAVGVRRLHDTDRAGWWLLVSFVPIVGWLIVVVLLALEGTRGPNRYGPDPLEAPLALTH